MKLNPLIDYLSARFGEKEFLSSISSAHGFLVHSDPRMEFLMSDPDGKGYEHSAMPLLDVTLKDSLNFSVHSGEGASEYQAGRFLLYQDSIWLMERKSRMEGAVKIPLKAVTGLEIFRPDNDALQRGRVSDFLDRI